MATAYTYPVLDGDFTTLRQFALACTNHFGIVPKESTIDIKDLPEKLPGILPEPDLTHFDEGLVELLKQKVKLINMSDQEVQDHYQKQDNDSKKSFDKINSEIIKKNKLIDSMLDKVQRWNPPTQKHNDGLKKFMIQQLKYSSMKTFNPPESSKTYKQRYAEDLDEVNSEISRTIFNKMEAQDAHSRKQLWYNQLRDSLDEFIEDPESNIDTQETKD